MLDYGKKLKLLREKKGFSQEELAEKLSITKTTIGNYENGRRALTLDKLGEILLALDATFNEFFSISETNLEDTKIPLISKVSAGNGLLVEENIIDLLPIPKELSKRCDFATFVEGNSMSPVIKNGDIVLVKKDCEIENGNIIIFSMNGNYYIKKYHYNPFTKKISFISLNKEYKDIFVEETDELNIIGRVVGSLNYNL
ncbi:LexA family protein [Fusobacterium necrophorum]|uniref:LexA family protein n=1 Tax=Fusobacterium necrophorum TaxID=859 RepID=UPI00254B873A|nr:LexA family transcriptional regulator [Fusobacterium necrophorum]MDK4476151.1 LexA family transcriptional regulator [Fusobacterium necrophorum]